MAVKEIYEYLLLENKSKSNLAFTVAMLPNQGITETYDDAIDGLRKAMRFNHYKNPYIYIIHHNLNPLSGVVPYKRVNKNNIYDISFEYANKVKDVLLNNGVRVELDSRNEKIGKKIREAQLEKVPYMLIIGDKEVEEGKVSVRHRKEGDKGAMRLDDFVELIKAEIKSKSIN